MDLSFPPGSLPAQPGPLARFMPPLESGVAARGLRGLSPEAEALFDPFGVSPRLAVEAAQAGWGVLVACSNPITRFVLEHTARPFTGADLRAALARLAAAPKDGSRLEPFLLDLYRTACGHCGGPVSAEGFIWDRDARRPMAKAYACPHCNHAGEEPATEADVALALEPAGHGLQRALALEQVAPSGDPDRDHAEAALAVYPDRALFALITLVNKLAGLGLPAPLDAAAQALILSACDAANALWGHPEGRHRPRQLSASPRYREVNIWRALEAAVDEWSLDDPGVALRDWQAGGLPRPGAIAVFAGPGRELAASLPHGSVRWLATVLPRPNQAFWTLSALWAAWLWGREAAAPIKVALHRRRYDWAWHTGALRAAVAGLAPALAPDCRALAFIPEAEPGFVGAGLGALDAAGFQLEGQALRLADGQAVLRWRAATGTTRPLPAPEAVAPRMGEAAAAVLRARGEPAPFGVVHAAAWVALAERRELAGLWRAEEARAGTLLGEALETALADPKRFVRLGAGAEPEVGMYWLAAEGQAARPLADRVEELVYAGLQRAETISEAETGEAVCQALTGLNTPARGLILACLKSYAEQQPQDGRWRLRAEDGAAARAADLEEIRRLLQTLGAQLGFAVTGDDPVAWLDESGRLAHCFRVQLGAAFGQALAAGEPPATYVLPGGRALLVAEKARRDPRVRLWLQGGVRVVKFRHVRRLAADTTLKRENLAERLAIDPMGESDPQLPLL